MTDTNTLDTAVNELADEPETTPATGYTPVFDNNVRTIVYVASLVASVIGLGFMCFGHPDIGGFISTAAGVLAGGFGVAYNPVRMAGK
ncbi:hypothetical protein [Bifidobacterium pullorum]|uniref:hypothetical protein n=1 Tax=Bifidobacterium pullorum TaxID=78448 RepID=UPI00197A78CE|nr:hypothetical protein [Bifidobacterium pullorum]